MNSDLILWLDSHLGAGIVLSSLLLTWLLGCREASAAQRCAVIAVFLAGLTLLTPFQGNWWPQIKLAVLEKVETVGEPAAREPNESQSGSGQRAAVTHEIAWKPETPRNHLPAILVTVWLLGAGTLLSRFAIGAWLWRRMWASASFHERTKEHELRVSEQTTVPMASGRQILMPADWLEWPEEDQRAALEHELAHARHRDGLTRGLAAVATALHWPSPLIWLAERRLRLAQEQRCDESVLASGMDAGAYGRLLLRCAQRVRGYGASRWLSPAVACMARPSQLATRIEHIAQDKPNSRPAKWRHVVVPLMVVMAGLQALHVQLVAQEAAAPEFTQEIDMLRLRVPRPMEYDFKDANLTDVLRFLASDVLFERFILGEMDEAKTISFSIKAPPLDALMHVCDQAGLKLTKSGRYWVVATPGASMPITVAGEAAQKLRAQKEQRYDFAKAIASDVLRFLLTDAGVEFTPLSEDVPKAKRTLTFSAEDSPFGVAEALCGTLDLMLVKEAGVWHLRPRHAAGVKPKTAEANQTPGPGLKEVRALLEKLPVTGRNQHANGQTAKVMLGDMLLETGAVVPQVRWDQTGRLKVNTIAKDHITFVWTESGKEDVVFKMPTPR